MHLKISKKVSLKIKIRLFYTNFQKKKKILFLIYGST